MKNRIIALILAVALLFALASCKTRSEGKKSDELPPKNNDLTVEIEPVEYSDEQIAEASAKVVTLAGEIAAILGYAQHYGDGEKEKIEKRFQDEVIPILLDVGIYPEELSSMLDCADECIKLGKDEDNEEYSPKIISDIYTKFTSILDTDRLGAFTYELSLVMLNTKLQKAQEKYDKSPTAYNLEDLEYFTSLIEKARSLGRAKFNDAFSVIIFGTSALNGSLSFGDEGIDVSARDVVSVMEKQGERFADLSLTESDWQTVAEVLEVFLPKSGSTVKEKLLLTLGYDDFFIESADVIPDFIEFYADITDGVSSESISLIENGSQRAYLRVLCEQLVKNEDSFRVFLSALEEKIPEATNRQLSAINGYDKAGYAEFSNSYGASAEELILAVKSFDLDPTEENYNLLLSAYYGYALSINSVVAYVYLYI